MIAMERSRLGNGNMRESLANAKKKHNGGQWIELVSTLEAYANSQIDFNPCNID
jgi:hypothetical protein